MDPEGDSLTEPPQRRSPDEERPDHEHRLAARRDRAVRAGCVSDAELRKALAWPAAKLGSRHDVSRFESRGIEVFRPYGAEGRRALCEWLFPKLSGLVAD